MRFPPKMILVPFDFSPASMLAWRQARAWGERFQAALEVIYVLPFVPTYELPYGRTPLDAPLRERIGKHIQSKLGDSPPIHVVEGDPVLLILELARSRRADMIVMGSHGHKGLSRVLLGSVAESVVRLARVPVLTLGRRMRPVKTILAPVNFTPYSERGLAFAAGLAVALEAKLDVFYATKPTDSVHDPEARLAMLIRRLPSEARALATPLVSISGEKAVAGILQAAHERDLIVLAAHKKPLFNSLVLGTTAERVIRYSQVPVLSIPSAAKPAGLLQGGALASVKEAVGGKLF